MALQDYYDLFQKYGQQYGIDPKLLMAVAQQESGGNPTIPGPKTPSGTARGLMGVLDASAQTAGIDATNPDQAVNYAAQRLSNSLKSGMDIPTALKEYYGGPNTKQWGPKTAQYPNDVLAKYQKLGGQPIASNDDSSLLNALSGTNPAPAHGPDDQGLMDALNGAPPKPQHAGWRATGTGVEWYDPNVKGTPANTAVDVARSIPGGLAKGAAAVAGIPGDIRSLIQKGGTAALNAISPGLGTKLDTAAQQAGVGPYNPIGPPTSAGVNALLSAPTGGYYQPQTVPGQFAETISSFAPAVLGGEGSVGARLLKNVVLPGGSSEAAGQLTQGTAAEPYARFAGALAPTAMGAGISQLMGAGAVNPARAALAERAINQYGIPLRGSQITSHPFPKLLDSTIGKMPFSGMANQNALQTSAFSRAVASTFGENADNLTAPVMKSAKDRIGNVFNTVAAKTTIDSTNANALATRLANIQGEAAQVLGSDNIKPIENQLDNLLNAVDPKTGTISGKTYKALIAQGSPLDRGMNSNDSNVRFYVGKIRDALDDALEASAAPQDVADLRNARLQYKNLMTVKDIATKAGIEGEITPALLLGAVRKSYKNMAFTGAGQIGDLANIGQEFLKEPPSSTTAERSLIMRLTRMVPEVITGAYAYEHPEQALMAGAGLAGTLVGGKVIGSVLKSRAYANALLNAGSKESNAIPLTMLGVHNLLNPPTVNYAKPAQ